MITRVMQWGRGQPLRLWIEQAELLTHRGAIVPSVLFDGGEILVCQPTEVEPPVPFGSRVAVPVTYDAPLGEYGGTVQYGTDLNAVAVVRVVMTIVVDGTSVRAVDALVPLISPEGT
jgi:hypothetical protein